MHLRHLEHPMIFRDLQQVSPEDPRVMALSSILGLKADVNEFEVMQAPF